MRMRTPAHSVSPPARRLKVVARQVNMRKRKVLVFWFVFVAIFVAFAPSLLNETTTEMDPPPNSEAVKATTRLTAVFPEMARTTQYCVLLETSNFNSSVTVDPVAKDVSTKVNRAPSPYLLLRFRHFSPAWVDPSSGAAT